MYLDIRNMSKTLERMATDVGFDEDKELATYQMLCKLKNIVVAQQLMIDRLLSAVPQAAVGDDEFYEMISELSGTEWVNPKKDN